MTTSDADLTVQHFVTSDGVRIAYRVCGRGDAVIVCHGGPSTTYEYLVGDLADLDDRLMLVFHDYRGSGASDRSVAASYRFERLADDVDELRQHLGVKRVSILAHSIGGLVALQYALRYSSRCRALALMACSPAGTMRRTAVLVLKALGVVRTTRLLGRALWYELAWSWRGESDSKTSSRFSIMHIMQEGGPAFRDAVTAREVFAENDNAAALERLAFQTDLCDQLPRIECPVLIIHGSKDAPFVAGGVLLERGLPHARRVELDGVGHHPLVEDHTRTHHELAAFLVESHPP